MVKIGLYDFDGDIETVWGSRVWANCYRIENIPFFVDGVSLGDVVETIGQTPDLPVACRTVAKSGHRTVRLFLGEEDVAIQGPLFEQLRLLGLQYENGGNAVVVVSVPAAVKLSDVSDLIESRHIAYEYADLGEATDLGALR